MIILGFLGGGEEEAEEGDWLIKWLKYNQHLLKSSEKSIHFYSTNTYSHNNHLNQTKNQQLF